MGTPRRSAAIYSFSPQTFKPSRIDSRPSPETLTAKRTLGDKLQLLALKKPEMLKLIERYVDQLIA